MNAMMVAIWGSEVFDGIAYAESEEIEDKGGGFRGLHKEILGVETFERKFRYQHFFVCGL